VATLEHSITDGRHFLSTATITDTCNGIMHSFILKFGITNQLHVNTHGLLRRLLTSWINWYLDNDDFLSMCCVDCSVPNSSQCMTAAQRSPHIPDVTHPSGFWAIVNVGNIIELAVALDARTYDGTIKEDEEEQEPAMSKF
jgi:hypothetical protein